MDYRLPTAEELQFLPMRAIVAYAARAVRRYSSILGDAVANDIREDAIQQMDSVSTVLFVTDIDAASVLEAAARVAEAYAEAPARLQSPEKVRLIFAFTHGALAATHTIEAALNPERSKAEIRLVARAAERAVHPLTSLPVETARVVAQAARQDYMLLINTYGKMAEATIGDPVACFGD